MKHILQNIKTTILGAFAGLPIFITGVKTHDFNTAFSGLATFLLGLFAKDSNN